ncbi:MAG TPA: type II toxin-antitoxin system VapC family toxin [Chthoniobacterales bacterium]|nr:type II toxin-antitoxin system VapC family toxin [Chthoniobacterales bacterium]
MRLLLDTHMFLWFISGDPKLIESHRDLIRDPRNEVFLSVVSIWEAIVKWRLGKLPLPHPPDSYLPHARVAHDISSLDLDEASVGRLASLPPLHRDPFDRMIVCQALNHNLHVLSVDRLVLQYPIRIAPTV